MPIRCGRKPSNRSRTARRWTAIDLHVLQLVANDAALRRDYEALFGALPPIDARAFRCAAGRSRTTASARPIGGECRTPTATPRARCSPTSAKRSRLRRDDSQRAGAVRPVRRRRAGRPHRIARDLRGGAARAQGLHRQGQLRALPQRPSLYELRVPRHARAVSPRPTHRSIRAASAASPSYSPTSSAPQGRTATTRRVRARSKRTSSADTAGLLGHFKTPGLRNVAQTAPYMHAGQLPSLTAVVEHYSSLERASPPADPAHVEALIAPIGLGATEIADVVAFLESLTGDTPGASRSPRSRALPAPAAESPRRAASR